MLCNGSNAKLLESIEEGFRCVFEGDCYGNVYANQMSLTSTPKGEIVGNTMAGPSDMITEDSKTSRKYMINVLKIVLENVINVMRNVIIRYVLMCTKKK